MGYWFWYLVVAVLAWAFKYPLLVALALVVFFGRRWLPDPVEWLRNARRVTDLRARVDAYPADLVARRDLARIYVAKLRPREAVSLLEEAIAKGLDEPETYYLLGVARLRARDFEGALAPVVRSVARHERLLLGDPYFIAAEALVRLGRLDEAEDALDRGVLINSSRVDGQVALARVRRMRNNAAGSRRAYESAVQTWHELPDFLRWKSLRWYLTARWELAWVPRSDAPKDPADR